MTSQCGAAVVGECIRVEHADGTVMYVECGICESYAVFAQEAQRLEDEVVARRLWSEPVALISPDYPF